MKTLFKETTENGNKTPGPTAMKGLFAEEKESCVKTPNQVNSSEIDLLNFNRCLGCNEGFIQGNSSARHSSNTGSNSNEGPVCRSKGIMRHDSKPGENKSSIGH